MLQKMIGIWWHKNQPEEVLISKTIWDKTKSKSEIKINLGQFSIKINSGNHGVQFTEKNTWAINE